MRSAVCSGGQRREADRRRVELAAAPTGPSLEQLRPGAADDEQRDAAQPVDELVDEVEQAVVGPVQVLEDEHERPLLGERLEEAPPGGERLAAAVSAEAASRPPGRRAGAGATRPSAASRSVIERALDGGVQLLGRFDLGVLLEDPGLRLDDLRERPERDAVAVGEAASLAPGDELGVGVDDALELVDEPALSHARDRDERDELRRPLVAGALERVAQASRARARARRARCARGA